MTTLGQLLPFLRSVRSRDSHSSFLGRTRASLGATSLPDALSMVLFATVIVLIFATYRDFAISWDERVHLNYGNFILAWYGSFFSSDKALNYGRDYLYGGAFDALGAMVRGISRVDGYRAMHLFSAWLGAFGIFGTWKLGRLVGGPWTAWWSALFLTITPVYWGHMFVNPKDAPFAVGYVWGLYYVLLVIHRLPSVSVGTWVKLGVALGASASVRIAGFLVFCYFLLLLGLFVVHRARWLGAWDELARLTTKLAGPVALAFAVAWATMLVFWPWALLDPLHRPIQSLRFMTKYQLLPIDRVFAGENFSVLEVPRAYIPGYLAVNLPEIVVVLAVLGGLLGLGAIARLMARYAGRRTISPEDFRRLATLVLLVACVIVPPAYAIAKRSVIYDGIRHFLFLVPPLAVVAAATLTYATERVGRVTPWAAWALVGSAALAGAYQVRQMVALHPHHYTWFNAFVGGIPGAIDRFDVDYYGTSYIEAVAKMDDHLWETEPDVYLRTIYKVDGCGMKHVIAEYFPPNFEIDDDHPQLHTGYTRMNCTRKHGSKPVIATVERLGATLNVVRDLR